MTGSLEERFQNLHEFVTQARTNLNRNTWDHLIGGSETETTLARNRAALDAWGFRPRVLRDVSNVDCSRMFFGKKLRVPVLCSAVGSLQEFDPGGGATVAEATRTFGNGMILSSAAHPGLEKTAAASGAAASSVAPCADSSAHRRGAPPLPARPRAHARGHSPGRQSTGRQYAHRQRRRRDGHS